MRSLLSNLDSSAIRRDPFPHIVASNVMDAADYAELAAHFPSLARLTWAGVEARLPNNRRFALSADAILSAPDIPTCWKIFAEYHSSSQLLTEISDLFQGDWDSELLAVLGGRLTGHKAARLSLSATPEPDTVILQDARIEINTPVLHAPSSVRGPHLDTPNRIFSGLFYLRAEDDDSEGGDLVLYRWRQAPPLRIDVHELPAAAVEESVRIPYRANQLVLFPQGIRAVHGVSPRHPTPHCRRYVFFTAELTQDWMKASIPEEVT